MIDRSEVVVHLVLGDEGRYVVDAVLRFLFHVLADHIIHRFLSDAGQVGHLRGVVEQSSIGVGDFALLRCGEFVLFCAVSFIDSWMINCLWFGLLFLLFFRSGTDRN